MATREFIPTVLLLFGIAVSSVLTQTETTYLREDSSGRKLLCDRCAPGFRLRKHCTETQRTVCQPCHAGFYTEFWNYINDCLPCSLCASGQVMTQECTASRNRVCECKEGFYWASYMCRPHTVCKRGFRVKEKGTPHRDTVCERCEDGYYSSGELGNLQCVPHTECKSDEKLLFHGTNYVDNACVTCDKIAHNGWVEFITQAFIEIFKSHNSSRKLHRFIRHLTNSKNVHVTRADKEHDGWIRRLQQWFSEATEEQVINLPNVLHEVNMSNLATKIEHRIQKIQDEVSLCRNHLA